jgi:hypothetical protein
MQCEWIMYVVEFPQCSPSGMSVHFITYRKDKMWKVWKNPDGW